MGPTGDELALPEPLIVFTKAVRPLGQRGDAGTDAGHGAIDAVFEPPVEGRWEWSGTRAARFVPNAPFALATAYTLTFRALPTSLEGESATLPPPQRFSTPRPTLDWSIPEAGEREIAPTEPITLRFTQLIDVPTLRRGLSMVDETGRRVPIDVTVPKKDGVPTELVEVRPAPAKTPVAAENEGWGDGHELTLQIAAGMRGPVGDRGTEATTLTFATRSPLHVVGLGCSTGDDPRCVFGTGIAVELSDSMRPSDLARSLTIVPSVKLDWPSPGDDEPTSSHAILGEFRPGVAYRIAVAPSQVPPRQPVAGGGLLRPLVTGDASTFVFAPAETGARLSFWGTYLPRGTQAIAARADETPSAVAVALGLDRAAAMRLEAGDPTPSVLDFSAAPRVSIPARGGPDDPPTWTSLASITPAGGPVLFGVRWAGVDGKFLERTRVLQRSDLALVTRATAEQTLVWATHLVTGAPLADVSIEARDPQGRSAQAVTGADGVATLATAGFGEQGRGGAAASHHQPGYFVVFAQRGDDWLFQRVRAPRAAAPSAALFSDRGLYRPGELVRLKGIVRAPTSGGFAAAPVAGRTFGLTIEDATGRQRETTVTTSEWGSFDYALAVPDDAPLGRFSATLHEVGETKNLSYASFLVREYRPLTLAIDAKLDKQVYYRGETAVCTTNARYLYGGAASGAQAELMMQRRSASYTVPGLVGFAIDDEEPLQMPSSSLGHEVKSLGQEGGVSHSFALRNLDQTGPEIVDCDGAVEDRSHDRLGFRASALVHPGDVYVGLGQLPRRSIRAGDTLAPQVIAATPEGDRRRRSVEVQLYVVKSDASRGWGGWKRELVQSCTVTTSEPSASPASCRLSAPRAARGFDDVHHLLLRATTKVAQGEVAASMVLWPDKSPRPAPRRVKKKTKRVDEPMAKLEAAPGPYASTDTAHLTATSPYEAGHVLLTVEREGVLQHQVAATTRAPVGFDVPLGDAAAPWVSAVANFVAPLADLRSRSSSAETRLAIDENDKKLDVRVRPGKTIARPGEEMDVLVDVLDARGRGAKAEVTLYAADEGTLELARYRLPDPQPGWFRSLSADVAGATTRSALGGLIDWERELRDWARGVRWGNGHGRLGGSHTTRPPSVRMGATSVSAPRRDFRQGAFFFPDLHTDDDGHLRAHVTLPEGLTTYRVMAFAATKGAEMGAAQASVVTNLPLQVRPILPRSARVGDRFSVTAMVANAGAEAIDAVVEAEVSQGLEARGPVSQRVRVAAESAERVLFDVEATHAGQGSVTLTVAKGAGADIADSAQVALPIAVPLALESAALSGTVDDHVVERLRDLGAVSPDAGGLSVSLSTSPIGGLADGFTQLVKYPYGCTEQTTSRLVPLLALRPLAESLSVKLPDDVPAAVEGAVHRVLENQQPDGGFGLWPSSEGSEPWLSAYATWGLTQAAQRGVEVNQVGLERARTYLREVLARWGDSPDKRGAAPFALDVLAEDPGADRESLAVIGKQLVDAREPLPVFAQAHLLHALARVPSMEADRQSLLTRLEGSIRLDGATASMEDEASGARGSFGSPVRTSALTLRALLAARPDHPMITPLALGLVRARQAGTWRTTQETAWALLALDAYRVAHPVADGAEAEVAVGETSIVRHSFVSGASAEAAVEVPMATLLAFAPHPSGGAHGAAAWPLAFTAKGAPVHYQARLTFSPTKLPRVDRDEGFELHRAYRVVSADALDRAKTLDELDVLPLAEPAAHVPEGAFVVVDLSVTTGATRRFVALSDPLPGGFEAAEFDLRDDSTWLRRFVRGASTRREARDDRMVLFLDEMHPGTHRFSYVVRATARGRFVAPPAHIDEMYEPEVWGATGARFVTIDAATPSP